MSGWRDHDRAESHFVLSRDEPGLRLHLRCYAAAEDAPPVLFVHGATIASRIFDVPWPGASWLRACAGAGFSAYALDVRGYGKSHSNLMRGKIKQEVIRNKVL